MAYGPAGVITRLRAVFAVPFSMLFAVLFAVLLLTSCGTAKRETRDLFDLGPLHGTSVAIASSRLPTISVADVVAPPALENPLMYYRLIYANAQQPQSYGNSRWTMAPPQLFGQRLKARLAQAGGVVLSASDGATNVPVLRTEVDEFIQVFDRPQQSVAHISIRASVFNGRSLVAQKTFTHAAPAPSADAAGGAMAMAMASDAVIAELVVWLSGLPVPK